MHFEGGGATRREGLQVGRVCACRHGRPGSKRLGNSRPTMRQWALFSAPDRCYKLHMLEFRILGPLEVWDGEHAVELSGQRQRAVLALLAIHVGEVVPS